MRQTLEHLTRDPSARTSYRLRSREVCERVCVSGECGGGARTMLQTLEHLTRDPSARTSSTDSRMCCMSPYLCDDVSIPTPIISPPEHIEKNNEHLGIHTHPRVHV